MGVERKKISVLITAYQWHRWISRARLTQTLSPFPFVWSLLEDCGKLTSLSLCFSPLFLKKKIFVMGSFELHDRYIYSVPRPSNSQILIWLYWWQYSASIKIKYEEKGYSLISFPNNLEVHQSWRNCAGFLYTGCRKRKVDENSHFSGEDAQTTW